MEKLYEVFPCSEIQKVLLATYTLKDEVQRWWLLIRNGHRNMTWTQINEIFYDKYFPQCFRNQKVSEFQELKQGRMSIGKHKAKFTELARFAPHTVDTNYKKARKFEDGLDLDILDRVGVLNLPTYVSVLDRALMTESILEAKKQTLAPRTDWTGKRSGTASKRIVHSTGIRNITQDHTATQARVVVLYRPAPTVVRNTRGLVIELWALVSNVRKLVM